VRISEKLDYMLVKQKDSYNGLKMDFKKIYGCNTTSFFLLTFIYGMRKNAHMIESLIFEDFTFYLNTRRTFLDAFHSLTRLTELTLRRVNLRADVWISLFEHLTTLKKQIVLLYIDEIREEISDVSSLQYGCNFESEALKKNMSLKKYISFRFNDIGFFDNNTVLRKLMVKSTGKSVVNQTAFLLMILQGLKKGCYLSEFYVDIFSFYRSILTDENDRHDSVYPLIIEITASLLKRNVIKILEIDEMCYLDQDDFSVFWEALYQNNSLQHLRVYDRSGIPTETKVDYMKDKHVPRSFDFSRKTELRYLFFNIYFKNIFEVLSLVEKIENNPIIRSVELVLSANVEMGPFLKTIFLTLLKLKNIEHLKISYDFYLKNQEARDSIDLFFVRDIEKILASHGSNQYIDFFGFKFNLCGSNHNDPLIHDKYNEIQKHLKRNEKNKEKKQKSLFDILFIENKDNF